MMEPNDKFDVYIDNCPIAKEMAFEDVMIFVEALFNKYYNDKFMKLTIVRHYEESCMENAGSMVYAGSMV